MTSSRWGRPDTSTRHLLTGSSCNAGRNPSAGERSVICPSPAWRDAQDLVPGGVKKLGTGRRRVSRRLLGYSGLGVAAVLVPIRLSFAVFSLSNSLRPFLFFPTHRRNRLLGGRDGDPLLPHMAANIGKQTPFFSEGRNQSDCGRGRLGSRLSQRWSSTLALLQRPVTVPCLHQGQKPLQTSRRRRQWAARPGPEPTVYPAFHTIPARHAQGEQHEHAERLLRGSCLPAEFHRQPQPDLESLTSLLTWEAEGEETRCFRVSRPHSTCSGSCVCPSPRLIWCLIAKSSASREQKANIQS